MTTQPVYLEIYQNDIIKHVIYVLYKHIVFNVDIIFVSDYKWRMDVNALHRHIGATIRGRRKQLKFTQEELAKRMATSRAALANIETGRQNVLVYQLYSFAKHLDLRIEDLLPSTGSVEPMPAPSEFPLPEGLNRVQREQISRLLDGAPAAASSIAGNNVSYIKRKSTS